jgi:hypothetical protein
MMRVVISAVAAVGLILVATSLLRSRPPSIRSIDRSDAAAARTAHHGWCEHSPGTGNRRSIARLSNGDETLKSGPHDGGYAEVPIARASGLRSVPGDRAAVDAAPLLQIL